MWCSRCMVFSSVVTIVINRFIAIVRDICFKASRAFMIIWLEIMDCSEQNSKHWVKLNNVEGSMRDPNASLGKTQPLCRCHLCGVRAIVSLPKVRSVYPVSGLPDWRWWSSMCSEFSLHPGKNCMLFTVCILAAARPWNDSVCQQAG